jgi:hypothetical protein
VHPLEEAMLSCDMDGERSGTGLVGRGLPLNPLLRFMPVPGSFLPSSISEVLPSDCAPTVFGCLFWALFLGLLSCIL